MVCGVETDIIVSCFGDVVRILVSQVSGRLGTWMRATPEEAMTGSTTTVTFDVDVLLGEREENDAAFVLARMVMEFIHKKSMSSSAADAAEMTMTGGEGGHGTTRSLLMAFAVKQRHPSVETVKELANAIKEVTIPLL